MEVFEAIQKRYSCRRYKPDEIEKEKIKKLLEAARLAPSAHNSQEWKFIVVKDPDKRVKIGEASNQPFVSQAPIIVAGVATETSGVMRNGIPEFIVNLSIALEHIALEAVEQGLATCWIGAFDQEKVKEILEIPEDCQIVSLLTVGYPADSPPTKDRKPLEEIISFNKF